MTIDAEVEPIADDAEQSIVDLIDAQMLEPPRVLAPAPENGSAATPPEPSAEDMAAAFAAEEAAAYSAEFAESLAAHRAAQDEVLPAVSFPAIAPALPGDIGLRATVLPITDAAGDDVANTWPPINGLDDMPTGQSLEDHLSPGGPPAGWPRLPDLDATASR